jgi:hypothetical protein
MPRAPAQPPCRSLPRRGRRQFVVTLAAAGSTAAIGLAPRPAPAAPRAELWPRWTTHAPGASLRVDHAPYAALLERHVTAHADGINRVRYGALRQTGRPALDAYVASLAAVEPDRLDRPEQMAYWINLYNSLTLKVVVDHYPVASIRDIDISPGLFSRGPWARPLLRVAGEALTLDDIEHRILRPIWRDPRIHYAVNCASIGCPNLQPRPFTAAGLEAMLEAACVDYVNHPRGVALVPRWLGGERVTASRIYDWFQEDFGGDQPGVLAHLRRHARGGTAAFLAKIEAIDAYRYDWALNDSEP